jgi:haloacetate dehalogenase
MTRPPDARFRGFTVETVNVDGGTVFTRSGGQGPPVLLLHGFPETHLMWHAVAPLLATEFTVVCADLPGYGASPVRIDGPPEVHTKRRAAEDLVGVMRALGHQRFAVVGHDRGGRVAFRLALDRADVVDRLAVLDVIPTSDALARADARFALAYWPWSLLAQPEPLPERLVVAAPDAIVDHAQARWGPASTLPSDVREAYITALRNPDVAHTICQEYRAAAGADVKHDEEDRRAGRRIPRPTLALWAAGGPIDDWYGGALSIWRRWAAEVQGEGVEGGHFFPEQHPEATAARLRAFLLPDRTPAAR